MAFANDIRRIELGLTARLDALRADLAARIARRRAYARTFNELSRLSDRELSDIGMNRSMIPGVALEAAGQI
jgi:uncharacterized protein YjiS (DUF1127 family)